MEDFITNLINDRSVTDFLLILILIVIWDIRKITVKYFNESYKILEEIKSEIINLNSEVLDLNRKDNHLS